MAEMLPNIGQPQTGQKAESGIYTCMNCSNNSGNEQTCVIEKGEKLPKCPICGITYWMKS